MKVNRSLTQMARRRSRMIAGIVLLGALLSACSAAPTTSPEPTIAAATRSPAALNAAAADIDQQFIDMMVPHHQAALAMAEIAQTRTHDPALQAMAEAILTTQQAEVDQMRAWRAAWYGSDVTPPMSAMPMLTGMEGMGEAAHPMDMQAEVEKLRQAPEPFDLAFIDAMIPHHQQAIDAAELMLTQAVHPEIQALAEQIIAAQQAEIDQMQALRVQLAQATPVVTP